MKPIAITRAECLEAAEKGVTVAMLEIALYRLSSRGVRLYEMTAEDLCLEIDKMLEERRNGCAKA